MINIPIYFTTYTYYSTGKMCIQYALHSTVWEYPNYMYNML